MITVMVGDVARYRIPNLLVAALLLTYPVSVVLLAIPGWPGAVAVAGAYLLVGFVLFQLRLLGGGDVKLLAVAALFAGTASAFAFLMLVAVAGGVLALGLLIFRPIAAYACSRFATPPLLPRLLRIDEPVPYGVAIALAFLDLLLTGGLPGF